MKNFKIVMSMALLAGMILPALTNAGKLYLTTESDTLIKDCPTQVKVMIDTEGEGVNSAGVSLIMNDSFVVNAFDEEGGVFRDYVNPRYHTAEQKSEFKDSRYIKVVGTTSSANNYNGEGVFGTYTITPKSDKVDLSFYMIEGSNGEDSNLVSLDADGNTSDILTSVENKKYTVVEGECSVEAMPELTEEELEMTVNAENIEEVVEDVVDTIEENVFDDSQKTTRLQNNWIYVAIALVALLLVVMVASKSKSKKTKKESKKK